MNPVELRINNFVQTKSGIPVKITIPDFSRASHYNDHFDVYEPIPLTEEWIVSFGFKPFVKDWQKNKIIIHTRKRGYVLRKSVPIIKTVHQLQNLYFALTGEELILKE